MWHQVCERNGAYIYTLNIYQCIILCLSNKLYSVWQTHLSMCCVGLPMPFLYIFYWACQKPCGHNNYGMWFNDILGLSQMIFVAKCVWHSAIHAGGYIFIGLTFVILKGIRGYVFMYCEWHLLQKLICFYRKTNNRPMNLCIGSIKGYN